MNDEKKPTPQVTIIRGLADDITLMPSGFVDASAVPIVGGLLTRHYVEAAEEMLANEDLKPNNQNSLQNQVNKEQK